MKKNIATIFLCLIATSAFAQVGSAWAWNSNKISNNGSVSLQSTNGSATYSAVTNPTGAVAKINQSSVTQPPTIIIQATSGGTGSTTARECIPVTVNGYGVGSQPAIPSCKAGYSSIFSAQSTSGYQCTSNPTYNIGGTNWSFVTIGYSSNQYVAFLNDNKPVSSIATTANININDGSYAYCMANYYWSASLCCK